MRTLVTGATGFVGSHLARALSAAGHTVRVLRRAASRLDALDGVQVEHALGDVGARDLAPLRAACEGCEIVFHAAAVADYWRADVARLYDVNVEGTRRVLQAAKAAGVRRVVFTSSAAAVGPRADGQPADERDPFGLPPKLFPYGHSKWRAEQVCAEFVQAGLDVVIVNPVVILGPGDLNMISGTFLAQVKRYGAFAATTSGGVMLTDVRDVAAWHLAAAARGRTGERYVLGTQNFAYRTLFALIADVVGAPRPRLFLPDALLPAAAALIDGARALGIRTPVDANQARLGAAKVFFNTDRTRRELGVPTINLRQSIEETYGWYVEHGYMK